ncbi:sugar ABC transporter ATP-binding protein [Pseudonocardia yuanmonensis]|uniref:Sugar ABC transporter ATP-binding protein n=1 Tax=Pseudonocardia yuanmonensis TaxID=1095914 RepID=A0ABP8WL25_9PSEU
MAEVDSAGADTAEPTERVALEVEGLTKSFGAVRAVRAVDLRLRAGEIRAVLGLNGAGKSTLVKMLSGVVEPDAGAISIAGNPVRFRTPADAMAAGLSTVHQELTIVPGLSVAENIYLGRWPTRRGAGLDRRRMVKEAAGLLDRVGARASPQGMAGDLPIGDQQLVEIARAVGTRPHVLLLDEPTSSLSVPEADRLIALVRRLAESGVAIIYISHRMDEIRRVADSVSVMRDGSLIETVAVGTASTREIVAMMTGDRPTGPSLRRPATVAPAPVSAAATPPDHAALSVRDLSTAHLHGIGFDLRRGEVLGVAGVLGAGRTSLLRALAGADPYSGTVTVRGQAVRRGGLRTMRRRGVGLAPEDRKSEGLALGLSIRENVAVGCLSRISRGGVVSRGRERAVLTEVMSRLGVHWRVDAPPTTLSGGKPAARRARPLAGERRPRPPARRADPRGRRPGETRDLRPALRAGRRRVSTIFCTSEFDELYHVASRALVLRRGRLVADADLTEIDEQQLMLVAMGEGDNV